MKGVRKGKIMNYATIGTGWIVDTFIDSAAVLAPELHCRGVYSRDYNRGLEFGAGHGISRVYTDLQQMAEDRELDGVYIASPNVFHYKQAAYLMDHGKHVLCEKTSVVTAEQLRLLYEKGKRNHCIFLEAVKGIYTPEIKRVKGALERLGEIHLALFDYSKYSSKYDSYAAGQTPNIFNPAMAAGGLMDMGIYNVYPAVYLFGIPEEIDARASFLRTGADAAGAQILKYPDKTVVLSYSKSASSSHDAVIMGTKGTLHIDSMETMGGIWIQWQNGRTEAVGERSRKIPVMGYEAECFYQMAVCGSEDDNSRHYGELQELGISVMETMEMIREKAGIRFPETCYEI